VRNFLLGLFNGCWFFHIWVFDRDEDGPILRCSRCWSIHRLDNFMKKEAA